MPKCQSQFVNFASSNIDPVRPQVIDDDDNDAISDEYV